MTRSRLRRPICLLGLSSFTLALLLAAAPAHAGWTRPLRAPEYFQLDSTVQVLSAVCADFNLDGHLDLAMPDYYGRLVLVRHSAGPTLPYLFDPPVILRSHQILDQAATGDFNGDGRPDVVAIWEDSYGEGIGIYRGTASGFTHVQDCIVPPTGSPERQVEAADLNQDGLADVVKENLSANPNFAIFLATPDSLLPPTQETLGPHNYGPFTLADATGDGIPDIVTSIDTSSGAYEMWILKGDGHGSFSTHLGPFPDVAFSKPIVADLNGDGFRDVGFLNAQDSELRIFFGTGGGSFLAPTSVSLGTQYISQVLAADMDNDGDIDLVTFDGVDFFSKALHVGVLRNAGNGTFGALTMYGPLPGWSGLLADVNEDGFADFVAVGVPIGLAAGILLNDGAGGFVDPNLVSITAQSSAIAIGDFNGDGRSDVATARDNFQDVLIATANPDGTYTELNSIPIGSAIRGMATGDMNRDGKLDLIVSAGSMHFFQGDGTGHFQAQGTILGDVFPTSVVDMNRDGKPDIVAWDGTNYWVYVQDPATDWSFAQGTALTIVPSFTYDHLAVGDWNRDGIPDLAFAGSGGIQKMICDGTGNLNGPPLGTVQSGRKYTDICVGDFNRDGRLDLAGREDATGLTGSRGADVFLGDGLGGFSTAQSYGVRVPKGSTIQAWDVNFDGTPDLVASGTIPKVNLTPAFSTVDILLGNGSGQFGIHSSYLLGTLYTNNLLSNTIAFGDLDRNGSIDILAGRQPSIETVLGATPSYGTGIQDATYYSTLNNPSYVAVGDVNRDGILDAVTATMTTTPGVAVSLGGLGGALGPGVTLSQSSAAWRVALADMNRDGKLDIVTSNYGTSRISTMLGAGDGTFGPANNRLIIVGNDFDIGDMDRDGLPDVVTSTPDSVSIYRGLGGAIAPIPMASVAISPVYDLDVADLNRDGYLDVVCAGGSVSVLYGGPGGSLSAPVALPGFLTTCHTVCVGDVNRDGYPDIVANDGTTYYVFRGAPFAPFSTVAVTPLTFTATDIQVGAAAGNGQPYVYALRGAQQLELLSVSISGSLTDIGSSTAISGPVSLALGDMNRDGVIDAVSVGQPGSSIAVNLHGLTVTTAVEGTPPAALAAPVLRQNYPNPFNPETTIRYSLPGADHVRLDVYDVEGRWVARLEDGDEAPGLHQAKWDGRTRRGVQAGSGVYFYRLTTSSGHSESKAMTLLR